MFFSSTIKNNDVSSANSFPFEDKQGKLLALVSAAKVVEYSLREKCPNTEFFLVRIFPHSDWIRRDTSYLSVFSPNVGKYEPEKTLYLDTFHTVIVQYKNAKRQPVLGGY